MLCLSHCHQTLSTGLKKVWKPKMCLIAFFRLVLTVEVLATAYMPGALGGRPHMQHYLLILLSRQSLH